jgi:FkbM family methyltransferase
MSPTSSAFVSIISDAGQDPKDVGLDGKPMIADLRFWRKSIIRNARQVEKFESVFGRRRAKWLLWRERWGDRSQVVIKHADHKLRLRLGTTDPLVWFSIFIQGDYAAALPFEPRIILDAGAYTGLSAVFFTTKYPRARIIAIEPDPANFELLRQNVRHYPNVVPLHAALWVEDTDLILHAQPQGHWASSLFEPESGANGASTAHLVPAIRIETLLERFGLAAIDVLKLDVEGAEKEIFEHSCDWIDRVHAIFVEIHDRFRPGCGEALAAATPHFDRFEVAPMTTLLINRASC